MYKTRMTTRLKPDNLFDEQELEILQMLAYEYNIDEICHESQLTILTIQKKLYKMYRKLEVNTRAGLIRAAFEHKILILA